MPGIMGAGVCCLSGLLSSQLERPARQSAPCNPPLGPQQHAAHKPLPPCHPASGASSLQTLLSIIGKYKLVMLTICNPLQALQRDELSLPTLPSIIGCCKVIMLRICNPLQALQCDELFDPAQGNRADLYQVRVDAGPVEPSAAP